MTIRFIGNDNDGVSLTDNSDTWILKEGNTLTNGGAAFDFNATSRNELIVSGLIVSENDAIDSDSGASGMIHVTRTGVIHGQSDGMDLQGDNWDVVNDGEVTTAVDQGIQITGNNGSLVNNGIVSGHIDGVSLSGDGHSFVNTGTISSPANGVQVFGTGNTAVNTGTISGRIAFLFSGEEGDANVLRNTGTLATTDTAAVVCGNGDETLFNGGVISGNVDLGEGADLFDGRGGRVDGVVAGGAGDDTYIVDDGTIALFEGAGGGTDEVRASVDFTLAEHFETLTLLGAEDIDGTGNNGQNELIGNEGNNRLSGGGSIDLIDGRGGDDVIDAGRGNDIVDGGEGNDTIMGRSGIDQLNGGEGDDFLFGGLGADIMNGGDGDDTLKGGLGSDTMDGGAGADTFVFTRVADSLGGLSDLIENFEVGADVLDFTGLVSGTLDVNILGGLTGGGQASLRTFENSFGDTVVFVDADGDGSSDMRIEVNLVTGLTESDFAV